MADKPETTGNADGKTAATSKTTGITGEDKAKRTGQKAQAQSAVAKPNKTQLARAAADPSTPRAMLADLAYDHPELRPAIARNPSTYQGLLEWLGELEDPEVNAVLSARLAEGGVDGDTVIAGPSARRPAKASDTAPASGVALDPSPVIDPVVTEASVTTDSVASAEATPLPSRPEECANCGSTLRSTANYCGACGAFVPGGVPYVSARDRAKDRRGLLYGSVAAAGVLTLVVALAIITAPHQGSDASSDGSIYGSSGTVDGSSSQALPQGGTAPPCPDGSTVVMWSEWDGGATVVCRSDDGSGYSMTVWSGSSSRQSTDVTAAPTGYSSPLAEIAFGGWIVWTSGSNQSLASTAWGSDQSNTASDVVGPASDIPPCPEGSYPISLSLWKGGWLLTCGVSATDMSSFRYEDGSQVSAGGDLHSSGDGYCGTTTDGEQVCVNSAPALVQIGTGSATVQHSVSSNYFAGTGVGGAGQGVGAYDVDTPNDTAQDQVNYLVAILEKSATARSVVKSVLQPLNACAVTDADVQSLSDLTDARTDLLNAVQSTPVDQIPDGANLLAQLTTALSLSEQADEGYVSAGQQMASGDCADGRTAYHSALAIADNAEAAKQTFVESWDSEISSQFSVRTFSATDI